MRDDYYYSGQYAEEQAEAEAQAKEGAHRQGKWHVSEHTDGRDALVYDADGFEVARVCYPNRDADARLIAVAPELLAAAQAAMHDSTRSFVPWDGEFEEFYAPGGMLAQASDDVPPNAEVTNLGHKGCNDD